MVVEAANDVLTIEALAEKVVDVVLVDIRMPQTGGIELARHLETLEKSPTIIFVMAFDRHTVQAFELKVKAIDYLVRPVRAANLAAMLQKVRHSRSVAACC